MSEMRKLMEAVNQVSGTEIPAHMIPTALKKYISGELQPLLNDTGYYYPIIE